MKKSIIVIVSLVAIVLGIFLVKYINMAKTDGYRFKKEYESLNGKKKNGKTIRSIKISSNNPIKYSTDKEIVKKIESNETFVVYFGFAECPWCRSIIENLLEVAKEKDIDTIYYVDVTNIRDVKELKKGKVVTTREGSKSYMKLLKYFDSLLEDYTLEDEDKKEVYTGEKRIYAPNIIGVVNGKAEKITDGISKKETDPYMKLTEEMNNESKKEIECLLKCIKKTNVCASKTTC